LATEQSGTEQQRTNFLRRWLWHGDHRYLVIPTTYAQEPEPEGEGPFGRAPGTWKQKWWDWTGGDHASVFFYIVVGAILSVITLGEYWIFTTDLQQVWINSSLFALSAIKFFMVVAFFMHLKFDNKWFTYLFTTSFFLAIAIFLAVLALTDKLNG
jgi:cytochrome c oxidase subunit 4